MMNYRGLLSGVIICFLMVVLTACDESSTADKYGKDQVNLNKKVVGTYIGEDGGIFSLFEDGSAEYFESQYYGPHTDNKWTYFQNRIYIMYAGVVEIYADANDLSSVDYYFVGEDPKKWIDEKYTKISDEAKHLTREDSIKTLEDKIPQLYPNKSALIMDKIRSNALTYDEYCFDGVVLQMPSCFKESKESNYIFLSDDGCARVGIITYKDGSMDNSTFEKNYGKYDSKYQEEFLKEIADPEKYYDGLRTIGELTCSESYFSGMYKNKGIFVRTLLINNTISDQLIRVSLEYMSGAPSYEDFYDNLINSIEVKGEGNLSDGEGDNEKENSDKETVTQKKNYLYVKSSADIMKEPDDHSEVLGSLEVGDKVEVSAGEKGEWSYIKKEETEGYVKSDLLSITTVISSQKSSNSATEGGNSEWKKKLPFKYDKKYSTSQNMFIYMTTHRVSPDEIKEMLGGSDAYANLKQVYSEEDMKYYDHWYKVRIGDSTGVVQCELYRYSSGGVWGTNYLSYIPTGWNNLGIRRREDKTYYIVDLVHPRNIHIGITSFKSLQEAMDSISYE